MAENNAPQESLLFMLGEMRADLKYLVNERRKQSERMDEMEAAHLAAHQSHNERISKLEHFKTRIGVFTAGLGVAVPTGITALAHKMGLF
jgi:hypothetical protein